jgi:hypothetical protein
VVSGLLRSREVKKNRLSTPAAPAQTYCLGWSGNTSLDGLYAASEARGRAAPRPPFSAHTAHDRWVSGLLRNGKVNKN